MQRTTDTFIASALRAAVDHDSLGRDDVVKLHAMLSDAAMHLSMQLEEKGLVASTLLNQKVNVLAGLVEEIEKKFTDCDLEI